MSHQVDIAGFQSEATRLLAQQVPPADVHWQPATPAAIDEQDASGTPPAQIRSRAVRAIVPQSFVRTSELVVLHRDPQRFDLLYRALWRLVYEPGLKHDSGDGDLARLRQMAQSVRRDIQKMRTRVAFAPLKVRGVVTGVAWYEPVHFITELVGGVLAQRALDLPWILLTPDRGLRWDGEHMRSGPGLPEAQQPRQVGQGEAWSDLVGTLAWT